VVEGRGPQIGQFEGKIDCARPLYLSAATESEVPRLRAPQPRIEPRQCVAAQPNPPFMAENMGESLKSWIVRCVHATTFTDEAILRAEPDPGMLTQGGQGGKTFRAARPPWPHDYIGFLPTSRCICMGSTGRYLPYYPPPPG
jgi:hypothetical protein